MKQIDDERIPIFDFPYNSDLDEDIIKENNALEAMLPFAIVSSDKKIESNGEMVYGRKYQWGVVDSTPSTLQLYC